MTSSGEAFVLAIDPGTSSQGRPLSPKQAPWPGSDFNAGTGSPVNQAVPRISPRSLSIRPRGSTTFSCAACRPGRRRFPVPWRRITAWSSSKST